MLRGRILDRYIIREILPPFFLSIAVLTLALVLQKMFRLIELFMSKGSSFLAVVQLVLYILPGFFVLTLPMSLLVATLTAFTRLSSDSEITAMRASRISLYSMVRPVFAFSVALFLVTSAVAHFVAPRANYAFKAQLFNLVRSKAMVAIEQGVFNSTFDGMVVYVDRMTSLDEMEGLFISDERSSNEHFAITAARGKLLSSPESFSVVLEMDQGTIHPPPGSDKSYSLMSFAKGRLFLDISQAAARGRAPDGRSWDELDSLTIEQEVRAGRAAGTSTKQAEIELQRRIASAYACLVFGIIGAPLGIRKARTGRSAGIALSILIIFAYYILLGIGANMAESDALSPASAYWLQNLLITTVALALVGLKGREVNFGIAARVGSFLRLLRAKLRRERRY
jgi:lipopolysaccharide export system permease protein